MALWSEIRIYLAKPLCIVQVSHLLNFRTKLSWDTLFHYGYEDSNIFVQLMDQIKEKVRIVLIIGPFDSHLGLVEAIEYLGE